MDLFFYYLARITFILLAAYGVFLIAVSIRQLFVVLKANTPVAKYRPFVVLQLLHGSLSSLVGLLLSIQLEMTWFSSLVLLGSSWLYMIFEYFGRKWYTARFA